MQNVYVVDPGAPQMPASVPQVQAPPPLPPTNAPQVLQWPPAPTEPQMPAPVPQVQAPPPLPPTNAPQILQWPPALTEPQMPAPVPQVQAPPPPPPTNAPQVLQWPPAPTEPTLPTTADKDAMTSKATTASSWKSTAWRTAFGGRAQLTFTMALATIALCMIILMLAITVFIAGRNIESSTADADSGETKLKVTEGQTSTKQTIVTEPLQPTWPPETPRSPPVEPSTPETTTTGIPEADREPLVCTMGERLTSVEQFPPDGLCDYIFYDSLYKDGDRDLLPNENTYSKSLERFSQRPAQLPTHEAWPRLRF
ncbi:hypothetical protein MTO96_017637 [Rhipicephalus appendiculatus]